MSKKDVKKAVQKITIWRKNPNMVTRVINKDTILLPIYKTSDEINCIYTLNRVGSSIWGLIDGKRTPSEIRKELLREFDAKPSQLDRDIEKFFKELKEIKAIV